MTIVLAQKFGERVIILADTMISDSNTEKPSIIPGRLKAIVISEKLSIAYAGHANQCHDVTLKCHSLARKNAQLNEILELLRLSSTPNHYGVEMEFIVAAHNPKAELYIIKKGQVSEGNGPYFLGNAPAADMVLKGETSKNYPTTDFSGLDFDPEFGCIEEILLTQNFTRLFDDGPKIKEGIGGVPINLLGSPYGHTYNVMALTHITKVFLSNDRIFNSVISDQNARRQTGEKEWKFTTVSSGIRGVPAVGVYLEQLKMGFLYLPTLSENAFKICDVDLAKFSETLEWRAKALKIDG